MNTKVMSAVHALLQLVGVAAFVLGIYIMLGLGMALAVFGALVVVVSLLSEARGAGIGTVPADPDKLHVRRGGDE